jgi:hypothetical protein
VALVQGFYDPINDLIVKHKSLEYISKALVEHFFSRGVDTAAIFLLSIRDMSIRDIDFRFEQG